MSTTRGVTINPTVKVGEVLNIYDFTALEIGATWYDVEESGNDDDDVEEEDQEQGTRKMTPFTGYSQNQESRRLEMASRTTSMGARAA
ncbi:unnamed protein product [Cylindrotheca closterium]|uniref:Uncharacterized protein n=1 Tax=Cylindrotheca closterium TaxID=2856 RepID=A0AAD2PUS6_9STRA|nr:unnamed protein product [Cylindrotheca closterium]